MGVGPRARSARKNFRGSRKYRKGVDHRKGGVPLERGGCKVVPSYGLLHVLCINGALPYLLYPPLQVLNDDIWLTSSFVYFYYFCIPEVSIKWITMGKISVAIQVFQ